MRNIVKNFYGRQSDQFINGYVSELLVSYTSVKIESITPFYRDYRGCPDPVLCVIFTVGEKHEKGEARYEKIHGPKFGSCGFTSYRRAGDFV